MFEFLPLLCKTLHCIVQLSRSISGEKQTKVKQVSGEVVKRDTRITPGNTCLVMSVKLYFTAQDWISQLKGCCLSSSELKINYFFTAFLAIGERDPQIREGKLRSFNFTVEKHPPR